MQLEEAVANMSLEGLNSLAQQDEQEMQAAEITDYYEGGHCAHPRQNLGQNEACWVAPALERKRQLQALFSLIVVLNRNTLAPSTIWSTERGR